MKTCRDTITGCLIFILVSCGLLFGAYKFFFDRPGFFRQFDGESEVRAFLVNNLTANEVTKDEVNEFMRQHLSRGERCRFFDATCPLVGGCPSFVIDETQYTGMGCTVLADVLLDYSIGFYFYDDTLVSIRVSTIGLP